MARDLELIAAERHDADGEARGERLLGDAHAAVADDGRRPLQQWAVGDEPLDARVGRRREARRIDGGGGGDDLEIWSANPASATSTSRPSSWNSVEQVTSTMGFSTDSSHGGGGADAEGG